jgi:hypothetical protein
MYLIAFCSFNLWHLLFLLFLFLIYLIAWTLVDWLPLGTLLIVLHSFVNSIHICKQSFLTVTRRSMHGDELELREERRYWHLDIMLIPLFFHLLQPLSIGTKRQCVIAEDECLWIDVNTPSTDRVPPPYHNQL